MNEQIDDLINELGGPWPYPAVQALMNIGAPAVDALCLALENGDPMVRFDAAFFPIKIGVTPDELAAALRDEDSRGRVAEAATQSAPYQYNSTWDVYLR